MTLLDWLHLVEAEEGPWRWAYAGILAVLLGALGELAVRLLFRTLRSVARRTRTAADDHLIQRVRVPSRLALATVCLHAGAVMAGLEWPMAGLRMLEWLLFTFIVVESAETLLVDLVLEERLQIRVPGLLRQVTVGMVYGGVVLVMLGKVAGVDLTPLLATTSVVSLVLGLALQQPLSNLFAGLVLHADRPFREEDWILVGGREGRVLEMGWRSARLATLSGDVLVVPNNALLAAEILNTSIPTAVTSRNIDLVVSPLVPPREVERWLNEELPRIPGTLSEPAPRTWLVKLEATCHHYVLKVWIEEFRRHDDIESDVRKAMWYRLQSEGYPLALETPVRLMPDRLDGP